MTPPSATTLTTIEGDDKDLFGDVRRLLKDVSVLSRAPHRRA
jgi:hypothetical protein